MPARIGTGPISNRQHWRADNVCRNHGIKPMLMAARPWFLTRGLGELRMTPIRMGMLARHNSFR